MKKLFWYIFYLLLISCELMRGQVSLSIGEAVETKKFTNNFFLRGYTENNFLVSHFTGIMASKTNFLSFTKDLVYKEKYDPLNNAPINVNGYNCQVINVKNKPILIVNNQNNRTGQKEIYGMLFTPEGKASTFIKLLEQNNAIPILPIILFDSLGINIIVLNKENPNYIESTVYSFNIDLKKTGSISYKLPTKDRKYNFVKSLIKDSNLLVPILIKNGNGVDKPLYRPGICNVNRTTGKLEEYKLNIPDMHIFDFDFCLANNKILCNGFYGNMLDGKRNIKGIYCISINPDNKTLEKTFLKEIPDEINDLVKGDEEMDYVNLFNLGTPVHSAFGDIFVAGGFQIKEVISRSEGTILLGERSEAGTSTSSFVDKTGDKLTTSPSSSSGDKTGGKPAEGSQEGTGGMKIYHKNNGTLALFINNLGEILWIKLLPIKQWYSGFANDHCSSFLTSYNNEKVFILYNDTKKNRKNNVLTYKDASIHGNPWSGTSSIIEIDNKGAYTIKQAFNEEIQGKEYIMVTKQYLRLSANELIITLVSKDKSARLGKLLFK